MDVDSSRLNVAMKIGEKFTPEKFRYMCIVAGCDYLASLPGIGIGKARKLFQLTANPDITQVRNLKMYLNSMTIESWSLKTECIQACMYKTTHKKY